MYREWGEKVAKAVRERDAARAKHFIRAYNKSKRLETEPYRSEAEQAYKEGYTNG